MDGGDSFSEDPDFLTVGDGFADFDTSFNVGTEVQYAVSTSLRAPNNDSNDCSYAEVRLEGPTSFYRESHASGDCGTFDPASGSTSGVLAPGEYALSAEGDAAVAGEDAAASGSADYGVMLFILRPAPLPEIPVTTS